MKKVTIKPTVKNETIVEKTGHPYEHWFALLEQQEAEGRTHKERAAFLHEKHQVSQWWSQMITVYYEQAYGMRERHEKCTGYEISVSKTLPLALEQAFALWTDNNLRKQWIDQAFVIHKQTPYKSLRITWIDGQKSVCVNFYPVKGNRAQVVVQHSKLASAHEAEEKKVFWKESLKKMMGLIQAPTIDHD